ENQQNQPNFDSVVASINYDQLFSPRRFYGHDRLEDNNFASLGLSYSLFNEDGLERLRASIGQSFLFEVGRVALEQATDMFDRDSHTGAVIQLTSQRSINLHVNLTSSWMSNGDNAQLDLQVYSAGDQGNLYNLGYFYRKDIPERQDR